MKNKEIINDWLKSKKIEDLNITDLSKLISVSPSAITRFLHSEGFRNYEEFKTFYNKKNNTRLESLNIAYSLSRTNNLLSNTQLDFIVDKILEKKEVIILGESFTYILAQFFERKLRKININARSLNVSSDQNMLVSKEDSIYIFLSNSGGNQNIYKSAQKIYSLMKKGTMIISIVSNNKSNIKDLSNETICGYFIKDETLNDIELPSTAQIVMQFIIDKIFKKIYLKDFHQNEDLIQKISIQKEYK